MSLVLLSCTVWYTDSPAQHAAKAILWLLILIIGMKGCEPGANECPDNLRLSLTGGSISSEEKSTYFVALTEPSNVLPPDPDFPLRILYPGLPVGCEVMSFFCLN